MADVSLVDPDRLKVLVYSAVEERCHVTNKARF
jgi:hypothetical protein